MVLQKIGFDDILWKIAKIPKNREFMGKLFVAFLENCYYNDTYTMRNLSCRDKWGKVFYNAKRD